MQKTMWTAVQYYRPLRRSVPLSLVPLASQQPQLRPRQKKSHLGCPFCHDCCHSVCTARACGHLSAKGLKNP